ncbi:MAG: DNA/RNA non-specific endonuclease [Bacteroidota bacterium]
MKNRTIYTILLVLVVVGFWVFENFYTPNPYFKDEGFSTTKTKKDFLPSATTGAIVEHKYFTLSYREPFEQAEWVAYELKKEHLTLDDRKRPYFVVDPKVASKSADWRNYKRSGFDRGHLCPAGDRRFSIAAYNETFYTSNITPQRNDFNAGIWNRLERKVRQWCKTHGDLYVITGGVLQEGLIQIGEEGVDVPNYFYKVIYRKHDGKALAFLIPHEETKASLSNFLVTIDSLEQLTQIDFFKNQAIVWQRANESKVYRYNWKF